MKVIQASAEVGEDHVLRIRVPPDTPVGPVDVVIVLDARREPGGVANRQAAARAGRGALKDAGISTADFLDERREDERRREKALSR
jgi:hypothetical protein